MCEWLSCGDWYDVYLLCGDRMFSAHRAVLASVSGFLRSLLLSNPVEDTPTFIVLPDYDTDAVKLVLYYIYNGEVIIKRSQMKMFLEIIGTLKIFIDYKYLLNISNLLQNGHRDVDKYPQLLIPNHTVLDFISENVKNKLFYSTKNDTSDNTELVTVKKESNSFVSQLNERLVGYLSSRIDSRQKQSFSGDLFIKPFSLNGNSNGVAGDVLAICNEHYREPTSVLLTNANAEQITVNAFSEKINRTSTSNKMLTSLFNQRTITKTNEKEPNMDIQNLNHNQSLRNHNDYNTRNKDLYAKKGLEVSTSTEHNFVQSNSKYPKDNNGQDQVLSHISSNDEEIKNKNISTKGSIFNEVLQSPWRSRLEYFQPLSRKAYNLAAVPQTENIRTINYRPYLNDFEGINTIVTSTATELQKEEELENKIESTRFKCYICKQVFTNNDVLSTHMYQHSSRYTCVECHKSFSQLRNFKYHMSVHRGTKEFAATCPICGKYFNDKGYLSSHMKIHRNNKEYKCSFCPKSFNQRVAYNMHVRIHTGIKPHGCEECGKAFSRKMLLKQHQRTHSGERPYACSYCDKRFADRSNMTLHLRLHTGVKPFNCTLCPKSFTKKHHLKSHLNFHTGDKPYSCPRCKHTFTQSSNMRTHYKKCSMQSSDHHVTS